jgi:HlyD family secretion protein
MVNRTLVLAFFIAIAVPVALYMSTQGQAVQQQQEQLSGIQVYRVSTGDVRTSVEASGEVESQNEIALSFEVGGRISDLFIQEGDYVLEGSILAVLENEMQQLSYQQAYLNVNRSELVRYDTLIVDDDELELASESLRAAWTGLGNADSAVTDADLVAMQTQYEELLETATYIQSRADQAPGGYESDAYNSLQSQAGEAWFNAELVRLQMDSAMESEQPGVNAAYGSVLKAQTDLEVLLAGPNDYTLDRVDLQVEQSILDLSHSRQDYAETFLIAPNSGVVSNVTVEDGSLASVGGQIMQLTDVDNLKITIYVDEIDIGQVEDGMTVILSVDALPGMEFEGTVSQIAPRSTIRDGVVVYEVELNIDDPDAVLRVGMTVDAEIALNQVEDAILVPSSFVRRSPNGQSEVTVLLPDGTRQDRVVATGLRGQRNTEILNGVIPGELILQESLNLSGGGSPFGG